MLDPLEHGWEQRDLSCVFGWFEGDRLPRFVGDFIKDVSGGSIVLCTVLHLDCSLEKFISFFLQTTTGMMGGAAEMVNIVSVRMIPAMALMSCSRGNHH